MENVVYLDTHVVIWLFSKKLELLSGRAIQIIENNSLLISPMVQLELQYLLEIERIGENPQRIISGLNADIGLEICKKNFSQIITKAMDYNWTRDPFDRILTAQAALNNSTLLTRDDSILNYYPHAVWD